VYVTLARVTLCVQFSVSSKLLVANSTSHTEWCVLGSRFSRLPSLLATVGSTRGRFRLKIAAEMATYTSSLVVCLAVLFHVQVGCFYANAIS